MFGRIRASPSPAECLEMESPCSKLFKDDSLSIYEATLLKLKRGSRLSLSSEHNLSPVSEDSMELESNGDFSEASPQGSASCSKQGTPTCSSDGSSGSFSSSSNEEPKTRREVSIQLLFSRYNNSHPKQRFHCYEAYNDEMVDGNRLQEVPRLVPVILNPQAAGNRESIETGITRDRMVLHDG
ncbi:hypothetical protein Cgig2_020282 [Carnegiea gigantea]|uniref:Uncharacterized protein n=1 Tax=Carnegiea gigantea TaxID=171969 RepID=A0A9Q1QSG2_9CARY|nr:hypothetical protein Cgig2_020282 [Carnegiea gigantea]